MGVDCWEEGRDRRRGESTGGGVAAAEGAAGEGARGGVVAAGGAAGGDSDAGRWPPRRRRRRGGVEEWSSRTTAGGGVAGRSATGAAGAVDDGGRVGEGERGWRPRWRGAGEGPGGAVAGWSFFLRRWCGVGEPSAEEADFGGDGAWRLWRRRALVSLMPRGGDLVSFIACWAISWWRLERPHIRGRAM